MENNIYRRVLAGLLVFFAVINIASAQSVCSDRLPEETIYKFDHFKDSVVLPPSIDGAPNFREVGNDRVYGTAQPTVAGLVQILRKAGASQHNILWVNLRAEPFLYINGRPYSLKDSQRPLQSLMGVASTAAETRKIESCLKRELLRQVAQDGGIVDLYEETADGKLVAKQEKLKSAETVDEVFANMRHQGYRVDFHRIPVDDEKDPTPRVLQLLLDTYANKPADAPLVANCQGGRTRTTTALAVFYITQGMDPDASIDKVAAVQHLRESTKQDDPQKRRVSQQRYNLLKSLPGKLKPKARTPRKSATDSPRR